MQARDPGGSSWVENKRGGERGLNRYPDKLSNGSIVRARNLTLANSEGELAKIRLLALTMDSLLSLGWLGGMRAMTLYTLAP